MTAPHPDPSRLLGLVDGDLDGAGERAAVGAHVETCATCQRDLAALRAMENVLARGGVAPRGDGPSDELAARMPQRLRAAFATTASATRGRVRRVLCAVAAVALLAVGLVWWRERHPAPVLQAVVAWSRPAGQLRGAADRFHFELRLPATGEVTIFALTVRGEVGLLFPADDAIVRRLAMPLPLPAGDLRLPADPLFDFEPGAPPPAAFVSIYAVEAPAAAACEQWRQALVRAAAGDEGGRRERIAAVAAGLGGALCTWPD